MDTFVTSIALGGAVTVDGSVAGITVATEIDITDMTPMSAQYGEVSYDLIAIQGNRFYLGLVDGVNDGSTPALRPAQLDDKLVYTRI
jgi:hypothetical protein